MILGKVIGSITSTVKHDCYKNKKLLLVKPITSKLEEKPGVLVAVDVVGAGKNDIVLVASEGKAASELLEFNCLMPLRSIVIAIVDNVQINTPAINS
ncbi:MAG: ethanolamine utilization protein EutN [Calditrichaeota bacterium]|nr:MAG: ethanolamine utilization protein EutN [Calditrichota bacterium]